MYSPDRTTAALVGLLLVACGAERDASRRADAVLSDGRTDGAPGFYFLPPVAPEPAAKENDRGLSPTVEIVALTPDASVLAAFSGEAVKESGSHYMVHWSTKEAPPVAGTTYRIRVLLDGELLGFADAAVAGNGEDLRFLASQEIFGLTGQRTVPVKFRLHPVESGDQDEDGLPDGEDLCPTVADPANLDTDGDGVGDACECLGVTCQPISACLAATCDPATGACLEQEAPAGTACDDGNPCTEGDACVEGECAAGMAAACTPPSECQVGACDPLAGCTYSNVEDGTTCTYRDGTLPGACFSGVCEAVVESKIAPR